MINALYLAVVNVGKVIFIVECVVAGLLAVGLIIAIFYDKIKAFIKQEKIRSAAEEAARKARTPIPKPINKIKSDSQPSNNNPGKPSDDN